MVLDSFPVTHSRIGLLVDMLQRCWIVQFDLQTFCVVCVLFEILVVVVDRMCLYMCFGIVV